LTRDNYEEDTGSAGGAVTDSIENLTGEQQSWGGGEQIPILKDVAEGPKRKKRKQNGPSLVL